MNTRREPTTRSTIPAKGDIMDDTEPVVTGRDILRYLRWLARIAAAGLLLALAAQASPYDVGNQSAPIPAQTTYAHTTVSHGR